MRESSYDIDLVRDQLKPCEEMSNVEIECLDIGVNGTDDSLLRMGYLGLRIEYPSDIKMITQARSVDLHALIGYIGGYIGLILGISFIISIVLIIPYFCIHVSDYKKIRQK